MPLDRRSFTRILIGLLVALPGAASHAESSAAAAGDYIGPLSTTYGRSRYFGAATRSARMQKAKARLAKGARGLGGDSLEEAGHVGQALVMMMIVGGVEIVRREFAFAGLSGREPSTSEVLALSAKAAAQLVSGGGTWLSFVGGATASASMKRPVAALQALLMNSTSSLLLRDLLQSAIASSVMFTGWEMGGQLWDEARELIVDDADYEAAGSMGAVELGAAFGNRAARRNGRRVLGLMLGNMARILVFDRALCGLWLSNAWRFRIATGDFVALIASMASVGVVGAALVPAPQGKAAVILLGLAFGVVGGTLSLVLPQDIKDSLTESFAEARAWTSENTLSGSARRLQEMNDLWARGPWFVELPKSLVYARYQAIFRDRAAYREGALTARFEGIYKALSMLNVLTGERKVALASANATAVADRNERLGEVRGIVAERLSRLTGYYERQAEGLRAASDDARGTDYERLYRDETVKLQRLGFRLGMIQASLAPDAKSPEEARKAELLLNKIYFMGFDEDEI